MYRSFFPWLRILMICIASTAVMLLPFRQEASAHAYSAAYSTLTLTKSETELAYALDELSVIELIGGDTNGNYYLDQEEFDSVKDKIEAMVKDHVILKVNDQPVAWSKAESFVLDRKGDATQVILKVLYPPAAASDSIALADDLYVSDRKTNYVNLLTIQYGDLKSTAALSGPDRTWLMQLAGEDYDQLKPNLQEAQSSVSSTKGEASGSGVSGWFSFFKLGMNHILTGYDHLLFLFSLLIARQSFKQYAAMVTAFTIAHSATLTLSVLGYMNVPAVLVEPAIALSICYVAADNIFRKNVDKRWIVTFVFGLIHGMGFADLLKEMNIPRSEIGVDLISFNIGIEAVQLTIVAVLVPLLYWLHRKKFSRPIVVAGSSAALLLGGIWLVKRLLYA